MARTRRRQTTSKKRKSVATQQYEIATKLLMDQAADRMLETFIGLAALIGRNNSWKGGEIS